jgi:hydrogenase maturation protease
MSTSSTYDVSVPVEEKKTVILGVGNLLLSDEGVGVHVINEMMDMHFPPDIELIEGGVDGLRLMNLVVGIDRLIVVDAVKGGGSPGSIYRFSPEEFATHADTSKMSVHQVGILEVIRLSGLVGKLPETTIIGVEPKSVEMGMELTPEIQSKVPRIIELVLDELKDSE